MNTQGAPLWLRSKSNSFSALSMGILIAIFCGPNSSEAASLTALGHLPNYDNSVAYDVSSDGSVVTGSVYTYFFITEQAFRWTRSGGMVGLGHFSNDAPVSSGESISADGSVIVGVSTPEVSVSGAYIWTAELGMNTLVDPLPPQTVHISASGVSADGTIVIGL